MEAVSKYITSLTIGEGQIYRNLAIFSLVGPEDAKADYISLEQGLQTGTIVISEVTEGGMVPELFLVNQAEKPVLIIDGEELVGAKQNRIINVTILVAAMSEVKIPVSCVEQGRWAYKTTHFEDGKRMFSSRGRAGKMAAVSESVNRKAGFASDQGAVWEEADLLACDLAVNSPTRAMADTYEQVDTQLKDYRENIRMAENQVGMLFFIDGQVAGLDAFGKRETMGAFFDKLVSSYAIDALRTVGAGKKYRRPVKQAKSFLEDLKRAKIKHSDSISLGKDMRLESKSAMGAALGYDGEVLHLCAFANQAGRAEGGGSGFASYRQRARRFEE